MKIDPQIEMTDTQIDIVLRLVHTLYFNPGMNAMPEGGFNNLSLHCFNVRLAVCSGLPDAHGIIRRPPLNHIYTLYREDLFEVFDRRFFLYHQNYDNILEGLNIFRRPVMPHKRKAARSDPMGSFILRSFRKHHLYTFPRIFRGSAIGKQHTLESGSYSSLGQNTRFCGT